MMGKGIKYVTYMRILLNKVYEESIIVIWDISLVTDTRFIIFQLYPREGSFHNFQTLADRTGRRSLRCLSHQSSPSP